MQVGDLVNASFEIIGAVSCWLNVFQYKKDREVKGVYWPMTIFWTAWGFWNLFYYPLLGQWLSFYAGAILFLGNIVWIVWVIKDILNKNKVGILDDKNVINSDKDAH